MNDRTQTPTRDELLELLASAPDSVIKRQAGIVRDALGCPEWCVKDHNGAEEIDSLGSHSSDAIDLRADHCRGAEQCVRLVLEYGPFGTFGTMVAVDDHYYTVDEARGFAGLLLEHADRIDAS